LIAPINLGGGAMLDSSPYRGLRQWLERVDAMGELKRVSGAHWDAEMGALTHMLTEKSGGAAPALLFDEVPSYPKGYRTLYGELSSIRRIALTLGLPNPARKVDIVKSYHERMRRLELVPPRFVKDGPILENVISGDAVDVLKFPVPRHHEADKARYIGTACCVITQDPDEGWFNLGTYRSQVYDRRTIGCQITEGKHGRIHRDKYFARGQPMKTVVLCGQDPLLFMLASSPLPDRMSEIEIAGFIRGAAVEVVRGPYTGFPIPADCEIAIEGEAVPGQVKEEGPFGEWMGYYSDDAVARPYLDVKTVLHRNDPILTCAPQHKPVDETGLLKGIAGAAEIWRALEACGLPDILGVWNHEAGPATRFTAIQIRQRYPGHARNVLHVASNCQGGAYAGKWTVVVDEDIDAGELDQVLWAMCTRFDPMADIDLIQKAWASKRDPLYLPGNFNNRILIDACIPYDRKLAGTFPTVVDVSPDLRARLKAKFPALFAAPN
jgi:UbiD family decarboxylase